MAGWICSFAVGLMFLVGAGWARYEIATDCRTLGSFRVKGVAFDCKPRVPHVKLQVKV